MVERLLSISGEDTLTVNRKYRDQWTGKLPARLMLCSNELPHLGDASMAVAGRFVPLLLTESFYGKEDLTLEDELAAELPGILNWALDGLERLAERRQVHPTAERRRHDAHVAGPRLAGRGVRARLLRGRSGSVGRDRRPLRRVPARGPRPTATPRAPSRCSAATCARRWAVD